MVTKRDIVAVDFPLPNGENRLHPVIVLSNDIINGSEDSFVGVMITGTPQDDEFGFDLTDAMVTTNLSKVSQVRCHLITLIKHSAVQKRVNSLRIEPFNSMVSKIVDCVFNECEV